MPPRGAKAWKGPLRFLRRTLVAPVKGILSMKSLPRRRGGRRMAPVASMSLALAMPEDPIEAGAREEGAGVRSEDMGNHSFFPLEFEPPWSVGGAPSASRPQRLIACGSRLWGSGGWMDARSLLGIRVYEFGVYVDEQLGKALAPQQAAPATHHHHPLSPFRLLSASHLSSAPTPGSNNTIALQGASTSPSPGTGTATGMQLLNRILSDNSIPVSIILRASRDLPLDVLQSEMRSVIERRFQKAGGSLESPELHSLIQCFTAARLPATHQHRQHVRKGATMAFMRVADGSLVATAFPLDGQGSLTPAALLQASSANSSALASSAPPGSSTTAKATANLQTAWQSSSSSRSGDCSRTQHGWLSSSDEYDDDDDEDGNDGDEAVQDAGTYPRGGVNSNGSVGHELRGLQQQQHQLQATGRGGAGTGGVSLLPAPLLDPKLSQALLDMYLGDQPVSKKSKVAAVEALHAAARSGAPPMYKPPAGQQLHCAGGSGSKSSAELAGCVVQVG